MKTIPLSSGTVRTIESSFGTDTYTFTTKWNDRDETYSLDIAVNGEEVVFGIKLVFGVDIAQQYTELPLNRVYVINKLGANLDLEFDGLDSDKGFLVIIEDSDLEV